MNDHDFVITFSPRVVHWILIISISKVSISATVSFKLSRNISLSFAMLSSHFRQAKVYGFWYRVNRVHSWKNNAMKELRRCCRNHIAVRHCCIEQWFLVFMSCILVTVLMSGLIACVFPLLTLYKSEREQMRHLKSTEHPTSSNTLKAQQIY